MRLEARAWRYLTTVIINKQKHPHFEQVSEQTSIQISTNKTYWYYSPLLFLCLLVCLLVFFACSCCCCCCCCCCLLVACCFLLLLVVKVIDPVDGSGRLRPGALRDGWPLGPGPGLQTPFAQTLGVLFFFLVVNRMNKIIAGEYTYILFWEVRWFNHVECGCLVLNWVSCGLGNAALTAGAAQMVDIMWKNRVEIKNSTVKYRYIYSSSKTHPATDLHLCWHQRNRHLQFVCWIDSAKIREHSSAVWLQLD